MRISVVVGGLEEATWRLQPWRYLWEMSNELAARGNDVHMFSERASSLEPREARLRCVDVRSVNPRAGHSDLTERLLAQGPDLVIWNVGVTSVIRLRPPRLATAVNVAIFTSPIYGVTQLMRVGDTIVRAPSTHGIHAIAALVSPARTARYLGGTFDRTVFLGRSGATKLIDAGLPAENVAIIRPGRDLDVATQPARVRNEREPVRFLFAGSPARIRGADVAIRAFSKLDQVSSSAKLIILSRHDRPELARMTDNLRRLAQGLGLSGLVDVVAGTLPRQQFLDHLAAADVIVLPFRLVPSEAPLAVLEAAGAGKPLIASALPAVADLAAPGSLLVPPGNVRALAEAMQHLALDPGERSSMERAAANWYGEWPTWREVGRQLNDAIRVCAGRPRAASQPTKQVVR